jgi:hypothetical protein
MKLILRYMGVPPLLDVQASGRATAYPTDQKVVQRDGGDGGDFFAVVYNNRRWQLWRTWVVWCLSL